MQTMRSFRVPERAEVPTECLNVSQPHGDRTDQMKKAGQIERYDPPGFMTDFDGIHGQLEQWSKAISGWFDEVVEKEEGELNGQPCQYYNQLMPWPQMKAPPLEQSVVWSAFPGTLLRRFGEAGAMEIAETVMPLSLREDGQGPFRVGPSWPNLYYRPHDEYCEWRVERDQDGQIVRVIFTSEPPEYWQALHGDHLPTIRDEPRYETQGDLQLLVDLYREYVSPEVQLDDLRCVEDLFDYSDPANPKLIYPKDSYNPYNRWNTTDGIMHLTQPDNSLRAEIELGGDATILRERDGRLITDPDALICATRYGGANRCSDPTIGATVNELTSLGCWITLRNPVGLYMDHLDLSGLTRPDGSPVEPEYFRVLRGDAEQKLIERAVFEVPSGEGLTVSDLRIGGVPIRFGGQLAQLMTVKLIGLASQPGAFHNQPVSCDHHCIVDPANPAYLIQPRPEREPCGHELRAFDYPDVQTPPIVPALTTAEKQALLKKAAAQKKFKLRPGRVE